MKGLELCRLYYEEVGAPELKARFPELMFRAAVGLSGQGSDCLGFDDEFSRDHDYGPGFLIWLSDEDCKLYGARLQAAYDALPREFRGFERKPTHTGAQRVGVMSTSSFYSYFTSKFICGINNLLYTVYIRCKCRNDDSCIFVFIKKIIEYMPYRTL